MWKMDRKLCGQLKAALKAERFYAEDARALHKEKVLRAVRQAQRNGREAGRIGFGAFLLRQIPFMTRGVWLTQGGIAGLVFLLLSYALRGSDPMLGVRHVPVLAGILAVGLVMAAVPFLLRSFQYRMYEVEMVTRMSGFRLLLANLILVAAGSAAGMSFCGALLIKGTEVPGLMILLYFFLPFVVSGGGCALILGCFQNAEAAARGTGVCEGYCVCLAFLLWYLYKAQPWIFEWELFWQAASLAAIPAAGVCVYRWLKKMGGMQGGIRMEVSERGL